MFGLHVEILRLLLLRTVDKAIRNLLLDAISGSDDGRLPRHSTTIRHTRPLRLLQVAAVVARSNFEDQTTGQVFSLPFFYSSAGTMASKKDDELYTDSKVSVLQDARVFNESPINPRKCRSLLTRVVFLLCGGEQLQTHEATNLFFATTKLFQHKDVRTRNLAEHVAHRSTACTSPNGLSRYQRTLY